MNSPSTMSLSATEESYNVEEAKDNVTDLLTQIEGHSIWIKEQFNSTQTRLNALDQAVKQSDRLKNMLSSQIGDIAPTQQQYELIIALKNDFLKAISRIQDDLVSSTTGQSLDDSKIKIKELSLENEEIKYKLQEQNIKIHQNEQQINKLRQENERLQRLKDLLMQQQDAMNARLSQQKGKDKKINELNVEIEELKQSMNIINQEKVTLNNNYKLQIESLNNSCKQLIDQNKILKQQQQIQQQQHQQNEIQSLQSKIVELEQENDILTAQITALEQENNEQIVSLQKDKEKLQHQFTILLQEKTDLKQENEILLNKYNGLNEKHEKLTNLNTESTERNLAASAQIDELKQEISHLKLKNDSILQTKIEELSNQINIKNKQISDQRIKTEEMQNQREALQKKLHESQSLILDLERKCQQIEDSQVINGNNDYPTPKSPNPDDSLSTDDLLSFFNINSQLKPIDEMITKFVSNWQYNSQVFILNDNDEIKENENVLQHSKYFKQWIEYKTILENVKLEICSMRENNTYQNESQQQFCSLVLDLISQKIVLLKHLGTVHWRKTKEMNQIMYEAQKRIISLQSDLIKKNREMEMHLKVKQKMHDEIKNVQQEVQNLTKEYKIVVHELDHIRGRGAGDTHSIDSY